MISMPQDSEQEFMRIFPFVGILPASIMNYRSVIWIHFSVLTVLYSIFFAVAASSKLIFMEKGIGIGQNPPFFAHLAVTIASIPIVVLLFIRTKNALRETPESARAKYKEISASTKLGVLTYIVAATIGLFSLSFTVVMSTSFEVDIYDSIRHPFSWLVYFILRTYQYLICYPAMAAAAITLPILLFRSIRSANVPYLPFALDGLGGLKKYLNVYDTPIFAIQSLSVSVALANYFGWGGFTAVSTSIAVVAPIFIGILAVVLYANFFRLVRLQKTEELQRLSRKQTGLYNEIMSISNMPKRNPKEIADELEASLRISKLVRNGTSYQWIKYIINIAIAVIPKLFQSDVIQQLAHKFSA